MIQTVNFNNALMSLFTDDDKEINAETFIKNYVEKTVPRYTPYRRVMLIQTPFYLGHDTLMELNERLTLLGVSGA